MDYPIHFADQLSRHLKAFRKTRGLTQVQLAKILGVTQSRVADIERDPKKVSLENVLKVLAALEVRMMLHDVAGEAIPLSLDNGQKTLADLKAESLTRAGGSAGKV